MGLFIIILLTPGNGLDAGNKGKPLSTNNRHIAIFTRQRGGRNKMDKKTKKWNCLISVSLLIDNDYGKNIRVV